MADTEHTLTRRKVLGSLGMIGGAAGLGGAGSLAFLSDEESFGNNRLVAGELDLKTGWVEYYSDWSPDEAAHAHMENGDLVITDPVGFEAATRQESFPEDGLPPGTDPCEHLLDGLDARIDDGQPRPVIDLADVKPGDFGSVAFDLSLCTNPGYLWIDGRLLADRDNGFSEPERDDPDEYSDQAVPMTGDAAQLTLSNGVLEVTVAADASGALAGQPWVYTHPDGRTESFLFFEIYALRDDANREAVTVGEFEFDFPESGIPGIDYTGTYETEVNGVALGVNRTFRLDPVDGVLVVSYDFDNRDATESIDDLRFTQYVDYDIGTFDNTDTGQFRSDSAKDLSYVEQTELPGFGRDDDIFAGFGATGPPAGHAVGNRAVLLNDVFSPARLSGDNSHDGDVGLAVEYSFGELEPGETATHETAFAIATSPLELKALLLKPRLPWSGGDLTDAIETSIRYATPPTNESTRPVFEGSLAQFLALAATGHGFALSSDPAESGTVFDDMNAGERGCFTPTPTVHTLEFNWELPVDHANELQGDSSRFDLGFYTEQCRHNDGTGIPNAED